MHLIHVQTGDQIDAYIDKLTSEQIQKLKGSSNFQFDWSLEKANEVYFLQKVDDDELLGLISITDVAKELRVHINLLESNLKNQGKKKLIDGIPGCLIGFVCQMSFKKGYDGFVSLVPKTKLINYYNEKFGFVNMGTNMVVFLDIAQSIIDKYLNEGDEKI